MNDALGKFFQWLVVSSKDANNVSLTVKGFLVGIAPIIIMISGLIHYNASSDQINALIDVIAGIVQYGLGLIALIMSLYGLIRKTVATLNGTHAGFK